MFTFVHKACRLTLKLHQYINNNIARDDVNKEIHHNTIYNNYLKPTVC